MLNHIEVTTVFVKDQDQAIDFYTNKLGLTLKIDVNMGETRWIEVVPEGAQTSITLALPFPGMPTEVIGGETGMIFDTSDIKATHTTLTEKGVKFAQEPTEQPWGTMAKISDPDGNLYMVVQRAGGF